MDRLLTMDKERFIAEMVMEARRTFGEVADAVNNAPDGHVISGSEMPVRDAMVELQRKAFEKAVQMRIDSTESSFSPSPGRVGQGQAEQGAFGARQPEHQRTPDNATQALACRRGRK
jgi:hypothetical protein